MRKEWYWNGNKSSKRGGGGAPDSTEAPNSVGCMCSVFHFFDFHPFHFPINQQEAPFKPSSCIPEKHSVPKVTEAPRNSLESEDGTLPCISKADNLKITKKIQIKTRGKAGNMVNDISSELSNSPGTKTPTLVARLMGLDLLPDAQSPSFSSGLPTPNPQGNPRLHNHGPRQHIHTKPRNSTDSDIVSYRSLPETPRISAARRSDVEHRLSLQISKENMGIGEELELPRFSFSKWKFDENNSRSPSSYARQLVKQVKESVSRKVGLDITNTVRSRSEQARERDEFSSQYSRTNKPPRASLKVLDESSQGYQSTTASYSPTLRFMETKQKAATTPSPLGPKDQNSNPIKPPRSCSPVNNIRPQLPKVLTKPKPQELLPDQEFQNQKRVPKCKKLFVNEKFSTRLKKPPLTSDDVIRNKQEEAFVRPSTPNRSTDIKNKNKKSHPLPSSSNLINLNTVLNPLPVKTDPSPPATKIPQKQSQVSDIQESKCSPQLSSCSRQRYNYRQEATCILATRESNDEDKSNGASTTGAEGPEFQYINGILTRNGADRGTIESFTKWFSPSHPLDPSIFHHLEQYPLSISTSTDIKNYKDQIFTPNNQIGLRSNRRLLFDLVDEILVEILRPKPWQSWNNHHNYQGKNRGSHLINEVFQRVESFPCANCQVLEDIDALIEEEDMPKIKRQCAVALEEEGEGIVAQIEGNILDKLVDETVIYYYQLL